MFVTSPSRVEFTVNERDLIIPGIDTQKLDAIDEELQHVSGMIEVKMEQLQTLLLEMRQAHEERHPEERGELGVQSIVSHLKGSMSLVRF